MESILFKLATEDIRSSLCACSERNFHITLFARPISRFSGPAAGPFRRCVLLQRPTRLGSPAVVVALFEVGRGSARSNVFPAPHKEFVRMALGLQDVGADVFFKGPHSGQSDRTN